MSLSKQLLAFARDGDFAHPGEIEAIELAMSPLKKNKTQRLLDVGCGLGGTANYLFQRDWGNITAIDLDDQLISYARAHYPNIHFILRDVLELNEHEMSPFNVIYCFSSFFCFNSQKLALQRLAQVAAADCQLVIFDYSHNHPASLPSPFTWSTTASNFHPLYLPDIKEKLGSTGWIFKNSMDMSSHFIDWYTQLLQRLDTKKPDLIKRFGEEVFTPIYEGFQHLLRLLEHKDVGGIIIYAHR